MSNIVGIAWSLVWVLFILGMSVYLEKKGLLSDEGSRKFVHIGVSNFWLIAMLFFTNSFWASLVPVLFIAVNFLSYRFSLISSMERKDKGINDLGTVYYPISLTILTLFCFSTLSLPYVGALGVLTMGYGDGFAAIIGKKWGKSVLPFSGGKKTVFGTAAMFLISFLVISMILAVYHPEGIVSTALILALSATVLEAFTPYGLDNLSVPLGVSFLYQLLFF